MSENFHENEADLEMILADMAMEFIENCGDQLDEIDACLTRLEAHAGIDANDILDIKRHVHSLKGRGATFRFPSITTIAHALEDYFETLFEPTEDGLGDVRMYVDRIREISETRTDPPHNDVLHMLRNLPLKARRRVITKDNKELTLLLHMPAGIQRKIIGKELSQFGFNVVIVDGAMDAIDAGLNLRPDVIMSTLEVDSLGGAELAGVFLAIKATRSCPFLLIAARDRAEISSGELPQNVIVLRKGMEFARDLMNFMKSHGYVGRRRTDG